MVERFASSCGGYVFRRASGTESSEWSFDDAGQLLGVVVTKAWSESCRAIPDSIPYSVPYSKVAVYGEPCEVVGQGVDQCGVGGSSATP